MIFLEQHQNTYPEHTAHLKLLSKKLEKLEKPEFLSLKNCTS